MAEAMDGVNRRAFEGEEGPLQLSRFLEIERYPCSRIHLHFCSKWFLDRRADARAQFAGRFLGESHRENLVEAGLRVEQNLHDQVFDGEGFARPGAGLNYTVAVQGNLVDDIRTPVIALDHASSRLSKIASTGPKR